LTVSFDAEQAGKSIVAREQGLGNEMGRGRAGDSQHDKDHQDFFSLLSIATQSVAPQRTWPHSVDALLNSLERKRGRG